MRRGTTPTLVFTLPFDSGMITSLNIAFAQQGTVVLEKTLSDCAADGDCVTVQLSEEDTLLFDSVKKYVEIQLRVGIGESRLASNIVRTSADRILKDGVLA